MNNKVLVLMIPDFAVSKGLIVQLWSEFSPLMWFFQNSINVCIYSITFCLDEKSVAALHRRYLHKSGRLTDSVDWTPCMWCLWKVPVKPAVENYLNLKFNISCVETEKNKHLTTSRDWNISSKKRERDARSLELFASRLLLLVCCCLQDLHLHPSIKATFSASAFTVLVCVNSSK